MNRIKVVALFGKAGAGKDTIQKELLKYIPNSQGIISNTTRAPRDYEKDGVDYYFISVEDFTKKILNGEMLEATEFNDWFYGTSVYSLSTEKINIGVFNPEGINCLWADNRLEVLPVFVDASDKNRLIRQINREENPNCKEICRRFFADEKDFNKEKYDFDYYTFNNDNELNISKIIEVINNCGF